MKVLLVWELVPDETSFYLLPDVTEEEFKELTLACGKYLNIDDTSSEEEAALINISDALSSVKKYCGNPEGPWACKWKDFKVKLPLFQKDLGDIDAVVNAGFVC